MRQIEGILRRVRLAELAELRGGLLRIVPEQDMPAIGKGLEQRRGLDDLKTVLEQFQIQHDLGLQQGEIVGGDRGAEARPDLLGGAGAADDVTALDDADLQPLFGEIGAADQAVMPGAHDDGVIVGNHPASLADKGSAGQGTQRAGDAKTERACSILA